MFKDRNDAYRKCISLLTDLKIHDSLTYGQAVEKIKAWRILHDSVVSYLQKDSVQGEENIKRVERINADIIKELYRLTEPHINNFHDLIDFNRKYLIKEGARKPDSYAREAHEFFERLDQVPVHNIRPEELRRQYERFLSERLSAELSDMDAAMEFFRQEDHFFRSFLTNLHLGQENDMGEICSLTEKCCMKVLQEAQQDSSALRKIRCFLAVRTNRRILNNTLTCINDINEGRIHDASQAEAYVWMLLQPFYAIRDNAAGMLTKKERQEMQDFADAVPESLHRLSGHLHIPEAAIENIPKQILKATLYYLQ